MLRTLVKGIKNIREKYIQIVSPKSELTSLQNLNPSGDKASKIDKLFEQEIIAYIEKKYSGIIISEETETFYLTNKDEVEKSSLFFVIDPLDGSRNLDRGIKFSSISLAVGERKLNSDSNEFERISLENIKLAIVIDFHCGSVYSSIKGQGSFKDNTKIDVSNYNEEDKPLISLYAQNSDNIFNDLIYKVVTEFKTRTLGSIALELCLLAEGALDAMLDLRGKSRSVDFAAGMLILQEAGGIFEIIKGNKKNINAIDGYDFIATNSNELLKILRSLFSQE